jgi:hypothetical protein
MSCLQAAGAVWFDVRHRAQVGRMLKRPGFSRLYSLRWQIELTFKELKSTLGLHQYQFREFQCVED